MASDLFFLLPWPAAGVGDQKQVGGAHRPLHGRLRRLPRRPSFPLRLLWFEFPVTCFPPLHHIWEPAAWRRRPVAGGSAGAMEREVLPCRRAARHHAEAAPLPCELHAASSGDLGLRSDAVMALRLAVSWILEAFVSVVR